MKKLQIYITEDEKKLFDELSYEMGKSISSICREWLLKCYYRYKEIQEENGKKI